MRKIRTVRRNRRIEDIHQERFCQYLRKYYPDVLFTSEASGQKLDERVAAKFSRLRCGRGLPDIFIDEPNKKFHGLRLEMKRPDEVIFNKDGSLRKKEHIQRQSERIKQYLKKGYWAQFVFGYEEAVEVFKKYLDNKI